MQLANKLNEVGMGLRNVGQELDGVVELLGREKSKEAIENGDKVLLGFLGRTIAEDGSLGPIFDGGFSPKTLLGIGSKTFIPGFEEQMLGLKAGDLKTIEVTFPTEYKEKSLAGKKIYFKVNILEVYKSVSNLYALDEEYSEHLKAKVAAQKALTETNKTE